MAVVLLWMAIDEGMFKACIMASISAISIGPVLWFIYKRLCDECRELEAKLARFHSGVEGGVPAVFDVEGVRQ